MRMRSSLPFAPRWRRLLALCYESLLLLAVLFAVAMLYQLLLGLAGVPATAIAGSALWRNLLGLAWLLALLAYFAWCWGRSGQTLAMKTWRLHLQRRGGGAVGWRIMALRFTLALLCYGPLVPMWVWARHDAAHVWLKWLGLALAVLPAAWSLFDRDRQFLHDRLAGSEIRLLPPGE